MLKKLCALGLASGLVLAASSVSASHIFFSTLSINGTSLETAAGFTDPTITVNTGESVTFRSRITGEAGDLFSLIFSPVAGSTLSIPDFTVIATPTPFDAEYTVTFSTAGIFDGTVFANLNASSPDYVVPSGGQADSREFAFALQVHAAPSASVPAPGSLALIGAGLGALGLTRRRKKT
jgi:hypothetical protein